MKIVRTIESFHPYVTGPANQAYRISAELESRGISSPILTTYCKVNKSLPKKQNYDKVHVTRFKNQIQIMKYCVSLGILLDLDSFDILHSHSYRSFQTDVGWIASKLKRKPFVLNTHGSLLGYKYLLTTKIAQSPYRLYDMVTFKSAIRRADVVVVSSRSEYLEALEFGVDEEKIRVIPAGIDTADHEYDRVKSDDILNLLFVGRISRGRHLEPIIRTLKRVNETQLTVVGGEEKHSSLSKGGYLSELKALANRLGVCQRVKFVGPKYGKELARYYQYADIFVYTSIYENFGQALLEAAAAGLPIISTPVGVAQDIVIDGKTGFLVNDDPEMISDRILKLHNSSVREKFGTRIREIAKKKFRWSDIIARYLHVYQSLL